MRLASVLALVVLAGCSRAERVEIADLSVDEAPASLGDVEAVARRALASKKPFLLREPGEKASASAWQCRVRADAGRKSGEGADELEILVTVELSRSGAERERLRGDGRRRVPLADESAREPALEAALADALERLAAAHDASKHSDQALVKALASSDARARDAALHALAGRKNPAAVPALIARLRDDDPEAVLNAVGALVEIGDRRAVVPLIELARGRDPDLVVQLAYAVAQLGGAEAEAWLFTQAQGAEDPRVRVAAREAGQEMQRRAEAPPRRSK